jgi:hypothetical protein
MHLKGTSTVVLKSKHHNQEETLNRFSANVQVP